MGLDTIAEGVDRFEAYLTGLTSVIGHRNLFAPNELFRANDAPPLVDLAPERGIKLPKR
jgi:hypothetical protein